MLACSVNDWSRETSRSFPRRKIGSSLGPLTNAARRTTPASSITSRSSSCDDSDSPTPSRTIDISKPRGSIRFSKRSSARGRSCTEATRSPECPSVDILTACPRKSEGRPPTLEMETVAVDRLSRSARSENMRRIHSKDSAVELRVRKLVHHLGFRYRLHRHDLDGRPDLVFIGRRKVIFVHGCFWHAHSTCRIARKPKSNERYWLPKLCQTKERDKRNRIKLIKSGWGCLVIWECQTDNLDALATAIREFLVPPPERKMISNRQSKKLNKS